MIAVDYPIRVLYIMGYGRSGSTVMDAIIGNHQDIESIGELANVPRSAWINNEYCACGNRACKCPFWAKVKNEWEKCSISADLREYIELVHKFERYRLRFGGYRKPDLSSQEFKVYTENTYALYKSIQKTCGKSIIVDSSKNPLRAYLLSFIPGIDLRVIHLIRDGRGVAWSLRRPLVKNEKAGVQQDLKSIPVWRSAIVWLYVNTQSEWVRRQLESSKTIQVRYEDFVEQPNLILYEIGQLIDIDFKGVIEAIEAGMPVNIGHIVAGNRMRMRGSVSLRLDGEWEAKMPKIEKWQFKLFAGTFAKKYGYN